MASLGKPTLPKDVWGHPERPGQMARPQHTQVALDTPELPEAKRHHLGAPG
jgi:hypothetical protein